MNKKTRIVVLHMKEVIYTGIFIFLGIVLIVLLAMMFWPGREMNTENSQPKQEQTEESANQPAEEAAAYLPGIYTASLELSGSTMEMQIIIESDGISNVSFTYMDDAIQTMYPLFEPVLESIASQLQEGVALEDITCEDSQKYTAAVLIETLEDVLESARR